MVEFKNKYSQTLRRNIRRNTKLVTIVAVIFSLLLIGVGVVGIVWGEDQADVNLGIEVLFIGVLVVPLILLIYNVALKSALKTNKLLEERTTMTVQLYEDKIIVMTELADDYKNYLDMKYSLLTKAIEKDDEFLLVVNGAQRFVAEKAGLTHGTIDEARKYLSAAFGERFVQKLKNEEQTKQ